MAVLEGLGGRLAATEMSDKKLERFALSMIG